MNSALLIPLFLGAISILQGAINKQISGKLGIIQTALIGNAVTLLVCFLVYFYAKKNNDQLPEIMRIKPSILTYEWWYIFPAVFGFFIVAGMPLAISKIGAAKVTVGLIAAQMITSSLWDVFVENLPFNTPKAMGILFAILSVVCVQMSK